MNDSGPVLCAGSTNELALILHKLPSDAILVDGDGNPIILQFQKLYGLLAVVVGADRPSLGQ